jgi:hypothetical protein
VSGTVTNEDGGQPVENATVDIYGVDQDQITAGAGQSLEDRARELIDESTDPLPDSWNPNRQLTNGGLFSDRIDDGARYAVAHTREDVRVGPYFVGDSADLSPPPLTVPAGEPIIFSVWTDDTGLATRFDEFDSQLPGANADSGTVIVKSLSPTGEVTSTRRVELTEETATGITSVIDPSSLSYGQTRLPTGVYQIHPKGNPAAKYVLTVGDPQAIAARFANDLQTESDQLSQRAQDIRDRLSNNKFDRTRVTTNASGYWSAVVPASVNVAGVQAYKRPDGLTSVSRTTLNQSDIRSYYEGNPDINESVYLPSEPTKVEPPASDVTVTMRELSAPPLANLSTDRLEELYGSLQDFLDRFDQGRALTQLQDLYDLDRSEAVMLYEEMQAQAEQIPPEQRDETVTHVINTDPVNLDTSDLRQNITDLQTTIEQLEQEVAVQPEQPEVGQETVSQTFQIDGVSVPEDGVIVYSDFSNGTTDVVDDQYVTVDGGATPAGGTEVRVEDYPLGDASSAQLRVQVASSEGTGTAESPVIDNPTVDGSPPGLEHVDVSSLAPAPGEQVKLTVAPADAATFRNVSGVSVIAPDGSTVTASQPDSRTVRFEAQDSGTHTVEVQYDDTDDRTYEVPVTVTAAADRTNLPPTIRAESAPAAGTYALTGAGLDGGAVTREPQAGRTTVTARADEPPGRLVAYVQAVPTSGDHTVRVQVTDPNGQAVSQRTATRIHMDRLPDGGLLYVSAPDGDLVPLEQDGGYGSWENTDGQLVIQTATDDSGTVEVRRIGDPSLLQRVNYWIDQALLRVPGVGA